MPQLGKYSFEAAMREGWALFAIDGGATMIQRLDEPSAVDESLPDDPVFESDDDAIAFVRQRAEAGSAMHVDALRQHGQHETAK